jgi:hypothetical protein
MTTTVTIKAGATDVEVSETIQTTAVPETTSRRITAQHTDQFALNDGAALTIREAPAATPDA